jgi:multidrug efflux system membrane fusion protein
MSSFTNTIRKRVVLLSAVSAIAIWVGVFAFQEFSDANAKPAGVVEAAAMPVSVQTVNAGDVRLWSEFSGRLNAVDYAEIRPEVSGRITDVRFKDGQAVRAGEILFVIDPRPFEAALGKAEADLASARTSAEYAQTEFERASALIKTKAIAQTLYDQRANAKRVADAAVLAAEAQLKQAKIDVDHAYVKAPIAGRISRPEITLGNLVQSGLNPPLLTSIVSNGGIYADFDVDEQTYIQSIRAEADSEAKEHTIPVVLMVQGDSGRSYKGTIYSFDNRINTTSGTIRARAKFDNKDGSLVPGMFAAIRIGSGMKSEALLVPERAIGNDQNKKFIYVVGGDNKVGYREVATGQLVEGKRIILSGLHPGERVIVNGLQHLVPDMTVQPTEETDIAYSAR